MPDSTLAPEAADATLDLRGLKCPLPVLHLRRALRRLAPGGVIAVRCTDPLAGVDIPHLLRQTGDALLATARDGDGLRFLVRAEGAQRCAAGSNTGSPR